MWVFSVSQNGVALGIHGDYNGMMRVPVRIPHDRGSCVGCKLSLLTTTPQGKYCANVPIFGISHEVWLSPETQNATARPDVMGYFFPGVSSKSM